MSALRFYFSIRLQDTFFYSQFNNLILDAEFIKYAVPVKLTITNVSDKLSITFLVHLFSLTFLNNCRTLYSNAMIFSNWTLNFAVLIQLTLFMTSRITRTLIYNLILVNIGALKEAKCFKTCTAQNTPIFWTPRINNGK